MLEANFRLHEIDNDVPDQFSEISFSDMVQLYKLASSKLDEMHLIERKVIQDEIFIYEVSFIQRMFKR